MKKDQIIKIIQEEAMNSAIMCIVRNSKTTDSCYVKLFTGSSNMLIRVSNHRTNENVATLRYDQIQNINQVKQYIHKKFNDLCRRDTKNFLRR